MALAIEDRRATGAGAAAGTAGRAAAGARMKDEAADAWGACKETVGSGDPVQCGRCIW